MKWHWKCQIYIWCHTKKTCSYGVWSENPLPDWHLFFGSQTVRDLKTRKDRQHYPLNVECNTIYIPISPLTLKSDLLSAGSIECVHVTSSNTQNPKTKEPLKVLCSSGIRGANFIPVYNFPTLQLNSILRLETSTFWISKLCRCVT